jgi:large subunit ribosomal protein L14
MIYFHTKLKIIDNSGGQIGKCIKIITSSKKKANVGDLILVVIKKSKKKARIKKKKIYLGLIVRTKQMIFRFDGTKLKFYENNLILLNRDKELLFTTIKGPLTKELRRFQIYGKIISRSYMLV